MSKPEFSVSLADLEHGPKRARFTISDAWLRDALVGTEATPTGTPGELDVELSKNGRDVMVRGSARVLLTMPSARSLRPVTLELTPEIFLLLTPAASFETGRKPRRGNVERPGRARPAPRSADAKGAQATGRGRGGPWPDDPVLSEHEAARDTFSGEQIVLDSFVREFIVLDLPMFPLASDEPEESAGLPSGPEPAIRPSANASGDESIDPRLRPLAEIASRLRGKE